MLRAARLTRSRLCAFALAGAALPACAETPPDSVPPGGQQTQVVAVDFTSTRQNITGFGASSAWTASNISDALADAFFSVDAGIGLSLLRIRIAPNGTTGEFATAQKAMARGASVWATPWSPLGEWKTNGTAENGGSLMPEHYQDWADSLANFSADMSNRGVPLKALSVQNEPNWTATWETCIWAPTSLHTFVRDFLVPTFAQRGITTKLIAPETQDWTSMPTFAAPLVDDDAVRPALGVIATHAYGGSPFSYGAASANDLDFWESEISDSGSKQFDPGMPSALRVARMVHDHLTIANVSAWHYWWLVPGTMGDPSNAGLSSAGMLTRRAYALGNYSKFVRPGFVRVDATPYPAPGLAVSAFRDVDSQRFVIVAVHSLTTDASYDFDFTGLVADNLVPWTTSDASALTAGDPIPVVSGAPTTITLPAQSVVTLVADAGAAQ